MAPRPPERMAHDICVMRYGRLVTEDSIIPLPGSSSGQPSRPTPERDDFGVQDGLSTLHELDWADWENL